MYCMNCGSKIVEGNRFCINCGRPVQNNEESKSQGENVVYVDEEKLEPIKDNSFVVPLVFGILLASILTIVCVSSLNKETTSRMNKRTCKVDTVKRIHIYKHN